MRLAGNIVNFILVSNFVYGQSNVYLYTAMIFVSQIYKNIYIDIYYINKFTMNNRIYCEDAYISIVLVALNSLEKFGKMWAISFTFFLENYIRFDILVYLGYIYTIIFLVIFWKGFFEF